MRTILNKYITLISNVLKTDIVKVFSLNAISTLVKVLTGFVSIKVVAVIIGPEGISLMGQLNNFVTIMMSVAAVGINSGVTKYVAEYKDSQSQIKTLISTALRITIWGSLGCGIFMILFNRWLSKTIMLSDEWNYIFIIFGVTIILAGFNGLLSSIVNGLKEFNKFVKINIANAIIGLIFSLILVLTMGLKGALIGVVTYQSIMILVTLWILRKDWWLARKYFSEKFNTPIAKKYLHYTLMTLVTAATVPISQLILRGYVISDISATQAGWWEAMNRISAMYLMVITTSFGVYYLPRLSELQDKSALRHEIFKAYKFIIPSMLAGFTAIYFLRFFIIKVLFSAEFEPMSNLFFWQMSGDLFKIASWLLGYMMIAKRMTKSFIATEIIFAVSYVGLAFIFLNINGIVGLTQAYLINYTLYFLVMACIFRKLLFVK